MGEIPAPATVRIKKTTAGLCRVSQRGSTEHDHRPTRQPRRNVGYGDHHCIPLSTTLLAQESTLCVRLKSIITNLEQSPCVACIKRSTYTTVVVSIVDIVVCTTVAPQPSLLGPWKTLETRASLWCIHRGLYVRHMYLQERLPEWTMFGWHCGGNVVGFDFVTIEVIILPWVQYCNYKLHVRISFDLWLSEDMPCLFLWADSRKIAFQEPVTPWFRARQLSYA